MRSPWAVRALGKRIVEFNIGQLRGRHTITLAIDSSEGRRTAHLTADSAERVSQRLADLAYHLRQIERET